MIIGKLGAGFGKIGLPAAGSSGALLPAITISNTTVLENQPVGTLVGTLSIVGGSYTGTPVFALDTNPDSAFALDGAALETAAALDADLTDTYLLTISVSGITPDAPTRDFVITVLPETGAFDYAYFPPRFYATTYFPQRYFA